MTRCEEVRDELALFVDAALDEDSMEAVAAHVAECPRCVAEIVEIRALLGRVRRARRPEERDARHWQDLARDIRLACDAVPVPTPSFWRRPILVAAAFAAAAVLAALVVTRTNPRPAAPVVASPGAPEAQPKALPPLPRGFEVEDLNDAELAAALAAFEEPAGDGGDEELALGSPAAADDDLEDLNLDEEDAARVSAAL